MKKLLLIVCMMLTGCGSTPADSPVEKNNKAVPSIVANYTEPGVLITIHGSDVRGADIIIKGVTPHTVDGQLIGTKGNMLMSVAALTSEGWIHISAIDTEPLEGKYLWIPSEQNAPIETNTIELLNKDSKPATGSVSVEFKENGSAPPSP